jgi:hypothetical protein
LDDRLEQLQFQSLSCVFGKRMCEKRKEMQRVRWM